jgi:hypothetical protein
VFNELDDSHPLTWAKFGDQSVLKIVHSAFALPQKYSARNHFNITPQASQDPWNLGAWLRSRLKHHNELLFCHVLASIEWY